MATTSDNARVVKRAVLTDSDRESIGNISKACKTVDGREFPLILGPPATHLLYAIGRQTVGYAELVDSGDMVEWWGMVHPSLRRHGAGRALLDVAKVECRSRGRTKFIIVCVQSIESGRRFAEACDATYVSSEHRMILVRSKFSRASDFRLKMKQGSIHDIDDFVAVMVEAYSEGQEEIDRRQKDALSLYSQPGREFYLAYLETKPIGSVATFVDQRKSQVFINAVGVIAQYQGQGYGREILTWLVQRLLDKEQQEKIMIEVYTHNKRAQRPYRSCGFSVELTFEYFQLNEV